MGIKVISHSNFPIRQLNRMIIEVNTLNNIAMIEMTIEKATRIAVTGTTAAIMAINTEAIKIMLTVTTIDIAIEDIHIVTMSCIIMIIMSALMTCAS
jgi:hypothetical protein